MDTKRSHAGGFLALAALALGAFTPAILAPLFVLAAFAFSALELRSGSTLFGCVTICLAVLQFALVAAHFGAFDNASAAFDIERARAIANEPTR